MTAAGENRTESRAFEADVAKLLHLMVHSVYSDRDVFLRELISNAADACEKLRYEAIANPELLGDDPKPRITITVDADAKRHLTVEDNGIGMSRDELVEALGTIARSGTRAFVERVEAAQGGEGAALIGQFGVGFYSAFMVAERSTSSSRRAGTDEAWLWSSDGQGTFTVSPAPLRGRAGARHPGGAAPDGRGEGPTPSATSCSASSRSSPAMCRCRSRSPTSPATSRAEVADGAALWTKPKAEIKPEDYTDFYRNVAGQFDEPALTIHYRAEGRQEYSVLAFVPGSRPFDLFDRRPQGPHQALREAGLHHRRGGDPAALPALRARHRRFRRPAAQHLARDAAAEPDPRRHQEGRDRPHPRRTRTRRRKRSRSPTTRSGRTSARC